MKFIGTFILLSVFSISNSFSEEKYITIGSDAIGTTQKSFQNFKVIKNNNGVSVMKIDDANQDALSGHMHENYNRCGGFIAHKSLADALKYAERFNSDMTRRASNYKFSDYHISKSALVNRYLKQVSESNLESTITHLESYHNRYYKSETGVQSQLWIQNTWKSLVQNIPGAKVELIQHRDWPQPSVILTIPGSEKPNEIVVIGGHGDSINKSNHRGHAPGADDNASGIATVTETIRILAQNNYRPARTLVFFSYAAEELGLLGSKEIAEQYRRANKNIIALAQFDMTNFKKQGKPDIVLMQDNTNKHLNAFTAKLIETYVPEAKLAYYQCGYGCSDHAAFYLNGYPTVMPSEARLIRSWWKPKEHNVHIHSDEDTLDKSDHVVQAKKFTKLSVAFAVEIAK